MRNPLGLLRVAVLFIRQRPSAIILFVISIIVNSVERATRRTLAHVFKESYERRLPLLRHGDASPAITRKAWIVLVEASALGRTPSHIFLTQAHSVRKSVRFRFSHEPPVRRVVRAAEMLVTSERLA